MASFPLIGKWIIWKIGNGSQARIGRDLWCAAGNDYELSPPLLQFLQAANIHHLGDATMQVPQVRGWAGWKSAQD